MPATAESSAARYKECRKLGLCWGCRKPTGGPAYCVECKCEANEKERGRYWADGGTGKRRLRQMSPKKAASRLSKLVSRLLSGNNHNS